MDILHLNTLLRRVGKHADEHALRQALTHISYYPPSAETSSNRLQSSPKEGSRYVFSGMYAFKGKVAEWLEQWATGSGTQLQHILGNLFSRVYLDKLYAKWGLGEAVRSGGNFDPEKHRHVFVYAYFGFALEQAQEQELEQFIIRYIIEPNQHLFVRKRTHPLWQLRYKAAQVLGEKLRTVHRPLAEGGWYMRIKVGAQVLADCTSGSRLYVQKKAIREALQQLIALERELKPELLKKGEMLESLLEAKEEEQKQASARSYQQKKTLRRSVRIARAKKRREQAELKDAQRRENKKMVKERQTGGPMSKKEIKELLQTEGHLMAAAKRRKLEDKLK